MRATCFWRDQLGRTLRQRTQKAKHRRDEAGSRWSRQAASASQADAESSPRPLFEASKRDVAECTHTTESLAPTAHARLTRPLQNALLGSTRESNEVRAFHRAIQEAETKAGAAKAFLLLTRSGDASVSTNTVQVLSTSLLERHAETQMGRSAYTAALRDTIGGADDANERWRETTAEERRCFAAYVCRSLARGAERGTTFNKDVGLTVEGSDNEIASLTEYHLRKAVAQDKMVPVPTDVLTDLVHLDVSWQVALRLLQYARELRGNTVPTVEMNDRVMGLLTGYRTNGLGSRPWQTALELYDNATSSGLDLGVTTHTHALDAVWRSADDFHKEHNGITEEHRQWILDRTLAVQGAMARSGLQSRLAGEEGCAYMESLIKATSAAGRWETAVRLLLDMETQPQRTSHRLLVPTAESFVFAMAACYAAGHNAHAAALSKLFSASGHSLRSLQSEVLLIHLQSLRRSRHANATIGQVVEDLLTDGRGLDRPCAVACLQLLSSSHVVTKRSKRQLACLAFDLYDANVWIQQPLARKIELQTVLRCCHLVDAQAPIDEARRAGSQRDGAVVMHVRKRLTSVFGTHSAEVEWLDDTQVYVLMVTADAHEALTIFEHQVTQRPLTKVKFLPMPVREIRLLLARALVRCCRAKLEGRESSESFALEDEDFHRNEQQEFTKLVDLCVQACRTVFANDAGMPRELVAELLLMQATTAQTYLTRKQLATEALQHLSLGSAVNISASVLHLLSDALSLTTLHVETTVITEHAKLRAKTLDEMERAPRSLDEIVKHEYL